MMQDVDLEQGLVTESPEPKEKDYKWLLGLLYILCIFGFIGFLSYLIIRFVHDD